MFEPTLRDLDDFEYDLIIASPNISDKEIREKLYKTPYTKEEVDKYMVSEQRKNSKWLKKARERASKTRWDRFSFKFFEKFPAKKDCFCNTKQPSFCFKKAER